MTRWRAQAWQDVTNFDGCGFGKYCFISFRLALLMPLKPSHNLLVYILLTPTTDGGWIPVIEVSTLTVGVNAPFLALSLGYYRFFLPLGGRLGFPASTFVRSDF